MLPSNCKIASLALSLCTYLYGVNALPRLDQRQLPADPAGVTTITSPSGVTIRYKQPGLEGVCETTPGVNSYSGYVDLAPDAHTFFWFFEARNNPAEAPLTLWLNGGPGSDSLIGLFQGENPRQLQTEFIPNLIQSLGPAMLPRTSPRRSILTHGVKFRTCCSSRSLLA